MFNIFRVLLAGGLFVAIVLYFVLHGQKTHEVKQDIQSIQIDKGMADFNVDFERSSRHPNKKIIAREEKASKKADKDMEELEKQAKEFDAESTEQLNDATRAVKAHDKKLGSMDSEINKIDKK